MRRAVSLGAAGRFEGALQKAGFTHVEVRPVPIPRQFGSVQVAVDAMKVNSSVLRELLGALDEAEQLRAETELRRRLSEFIEADGRCAVPGEALLGVASAS